MSRRAHRPELEFGSDSFLDVVCNIVGILIILIVVVAVKVERQPKGGVPVAAAQEVAVEAPGRLRVKLNVPFPLDSATQEY